MSSVDLRPVAYGTKLTLKVGCVLVTDGAHRILTDPGCFRTRAELDDALMHSAGITLADIDTVFFTHLHFDHYFDLGFADVGEVAMPRADIAYFAQAGERRHDPQAFRRYIEDSYEYVAPVFLREFARVANDPRYDFANTSFADRLRLIEPGERLSANTEVVDLPGHSPGHCGLACTSQWGRTLIAGDAVLSLEEALQPDSADYQLIYFDRAALLDTRRRCLDYDAVVPGHGRWFSPATRQLLTNPGETLHG